MMPKPTHKLWCLIVTQGCDIVFERFKVYAKFALDNGRVALHVFVNVEQDQTSFMLSLTLSN